MTVTASLGGLEVGGPPTGMSWSIEYDDATRNVTATALGAGWCLVVVQITASVTRTVGFYPSATGLTVESRNPDFAGMATADFRIVADGSTVILASNVNPNQVSRIVGKSGSVVGGLPSTGGWSRV